MNPDNKPMEIQKLAALASRAEMARLGPGRRTRVLAAASQPAKAVWPAWAQASLAAAALLVVLSTPALLLDENTPGKALVAPHDRDDLNLQVSLGHDGNVVLEWENGKPVHTLRVATSPRDLAKVNGIQVAGQRYEDASSHGAQIVYYQVD